MTSAKVRFFNLSGPKMAKKNKRRIYQIIFIVILFLFIVIFIKEFGTVSKAIELLSGGSWYFLFAVIAIQALGIINDGAFYQSLYDIFGVKESMKRLIILALSSNFLNLAAPTGGLSGVAVFVSDAERHGMNKSQATIVNFLGYFMTICINIFALLFGLFFLLFNNQLQRYQLITAGVLFGAFFVLVLMVILALEEARRFKKLFGYIASAINYFAEKLRKKEDVISKKQVNILTEEIHESLYIIQSKWKTLWLPAVHVVVSIVVDVLTLQYILLAFHFPANIGTLLTVYAIGFLFTIVSITPSGVGVVEATMILVMSGLSVPVELSAVAVIGYRFLNFWLPFLLGFFAFRVFQVQKLNEIKNGSRRLARG